MRHNKQLVRITLLRLSFSLTSLSFSQRCFPFYYDNALTVYTSRVNRALRIFDIRELFEIEDSIRIRIVLKIGIRVF